MFDVAVIVIMLISGVLAFFRGFTSEIISILAWVAGTLMSLWLYPYLLPFMGSFVSPDWLAAAISAAVIFTIVFVAISALTYKWGEKIRNSHIGMLDRTLGFVFGVMRGLIVISVAFLFFSWLVVDRNDHPDWVRTAKLLPIVESTSQALHGAMQGLVGDEADKGLISIPKAANRPEGKNSSKRDNSTTDSTPATGYKPSERRGLDQLFEATSE
ncbi:MAG: CvpA family protein [Rhodobiaceae bacterium]|nr:CvpA family protein [Rhodobiaceae bacterium]